MQSWASTTGGITRNSITKYGKRRRKARIFAGRYFIAEWSCGTWCTNAVMADVMTAKIYETPFGGVTGCQSVTGDHDTIEPRANSSLLIVRGSLEIGDDGAGDWPCGTFYYLWTANRFRLIGCGILAMEIGPYTQ